MLPTRRLLALSLSVLGPVATPAGAQTLGAPKSAGAAAEAARADSAGRAAAVASTSIAILPFASLLSGDVPQKLTARLNGEVTGAFTRSNAWQVLDRTADVALRKEMDRVQSGDQFESTIRVQQGRGLNARYLVLGLLQNARSDEVRGSNGKETYTATLTYRISVSDVETNQNMLDSSMTVSSADIAKSAVAGRLRNEAVREGVRALGDLLPGRRRKTDKSDRVEEGVRTAAGNVVGAPTVDEAIDRAIRVARERFDRFAASAALAARRQRR